MLILSFQEVNRVLRPGGSIEIIEEGSFVQFTALERHQSLPDIIFPSLPRWFIDALHNHDLRESSVNLSDWPSLSVPFTSHKVIPHDHALLESLMASVFEERFINIKPTG